MRYFAALRASPMIYEMLRREVRFQLNVISAIYRHS